MLKSVEGIYRDGTVELLELPEYVEDETVVIVTFLPPTRVKSGDIDLQARGIDRSQAADLRARLASFAEEWDSPDMAIYDTYDSTKSRV